MLRWTIKTQDPAGWVKPTGEGSDSLYHAKQIAQDLASAQRNTTFFVESTSNGRVPAVYHFAKTVS